MNKAPWNKAPWIVAAFAVVLVAAAAHIARPRTAPDSAATATAAAPAPTSQYDFELTDTAGRDVSLASYRGKWLVIFFGFTSCPDICPTTLLNVSAALAAMGEAAKNIQPIFITVDPERDTPEQIKTYLVNFDENIVGLSGTPAQIAKVAENYEMPFRKRDTGDGSYSIDHSPALHVISPAGAYARIIFPNPDAGELARQLTEATRTP